MKSKSGISIFFPCYNDEHTIGQLVKTAVSAVSSVTDAREVIVVDDGSTDTNREGVRSIMRYDPQELLLLLPLMTKNTDVVNGIKIVRKDPTYRMIVGNLYNFIVRWLFWLPVQDVDCDFRLIRKRIIKHIPLTSQSGAICVELIKKAQLAGARFREASVHHFDRLHGASQLFKLQRITETFFELIKLKIHLMINKLHTPYVYD